MNDNYNIIEMVKIALGLHDGNLTDIMSHKESLIRNIDWHIEDLVKWRSRINSLPTAVDSIWK